MNAVKWMREPNSVPWKLRRIVARIENLKKSEHRWSVSHIFRESNSIADELAKSGVDRLESWIETGKLQGPW